MLIDPPKLQLRAPGAYRGSVYGTANVPLLSIDRAFLKSVSCRVRKNQVVRFLPIFLQYANDGESDIPTHLLDATTASIATNSGTSPPIVPKPRFVSSVEAGSVYARFTGTLRNFFALPFVHPILLFLVVHSSFPLSYGSLSLACFYVPPLSILRYRLTLSFHCRPKDALTHTRSSTCLFHIYLFVNLPDSSGLLHGLFPFSCLFHRYLFLPFRHRHSSHLHPAPFRIRSFHFLPTYFALLL